MNGNAVSSGASRYPKKNAVIRLTLTGFGVNDFEDPPIHVEWSEVTGIAAFKRDIFAVDLICLVFRYGDGHRELCVDEEMAGYSKLTEEIERRFPDHTPEWWTKTAFPPFSTCWTVIWGDMPEPAECPKCAADITGCTEDACPKCSVSLQTVSCPDCRGRGKTPIWSWRWATFTSVVSIAAIPIIPRFCGSQGEGGGWLSLWATITFAACIIAVSFLMAWRSRSWPCERCENTGWWDPRGRAACRIPESQQDLTG